MSKRELAINYFLQGYNCCQSVVLAFKEYFSLPEEELTKIVSPFGGGISRLRETCGAVSGMSIVIGQIFGYNELDDNKKKETYRITQELILQFEEKYGSLICRELLKKSVKHDSYVPTTRDASFYKDRPCLEFIGGAAQILEDYFKKHGVTKLCA